MVTADADGFKTVADEVGVQHQVCKAHVLRNIEDLIERNLPLVARDADGSLHAIGVSPIAMSPVGGHIWRQFSVAS